jgi:cytoskeletal protein CcmA (bactofilin family)
MSDERLSRNATISSVPESLSLVDRYSSVDGTFTTTRDVRIEGELRGTLRCDGYVHVAEGATVEATVEAANITVAGLLRGSISCRGKLTVLATGQVRGTVSTRFLVVNEGGCCEGEIQMEMEMLDTSDRPALPTTNRSEVRRSRHRALDERGEQRGTAIPVPNA